mmetsp:Transcript_15095/g.26217  ORF Transcript_15095/g.26217 Transcript_15095/m.26217 type:complete len:347 (+) Transcript_15095:53-1093(+)
MGRDDSPDWTTIESDPGVFTELIERIGVSGVQVEELWSCDKESLLQLSPVYGLIFLFKYVKDEVKRTPAPDTLGTVFFAQQVIQNACATQAILSILLNIAPGTPGISLGPELTSFREFTSELPPDMKGLAISNSDLIREQHNKFHKPESLVPDEKEESKDGEAFHFIAYLPVGETLYELDGLQAGPFALAEGLNSESDWLEAVVPHIQARMQRYAASEVRFNLMGLVADRRQVLGQQAEAMTARRESVLAALSGAPPSAGLPTDPQVLLEQAAQLEAELASIQEQVAEEHAKRQSWTDENIRRRHNYIPLLFQLVKAVAAAGELGPFLDLAKQPSKRKPAKEQDES